MKIFRFSSINLFLGIITCVGGIAGVALGSTLSMLLRAGTGPFKLIQTIRSDPIICGVGALIGVPTLYFSLHMIPTSMTATYVSSWLFFVSRNFQSIFGYLLLEGLNISRMVL
ncbi:hypothetical protein OESDEN_15850 [Oesophagostomum dentatum]|uniref:Uncharacterized protein n=1 Tax=Oesophagostomum dentatum TaxID=61180 RepID=A0A0B1SKL7_OESDE|nr:hypothetical protein OESDEN_15850 [Oesophagostomum dentatum]